MSNASIPAIQQFQPPNIPNAALNALQVRNAREQIQNIAMARQVAQQQAMAQQQKIQREQNVAKRKNEIEIKDFALNILSGVNSAEDLEIARGQFNARYPQYTDMTNKIMSDYNPRKVDLIRNSLRTETQRMKQEEIEWERENEIVGFGAGSAVYKGGEWTEQVPFAPAKPSAPKFEVFSNQEGNQIYVEKGESIPAGYSKVQAKGTQVTIQTGDLGKTTRGKLEMDIIEGTRNIQSFQKTRGLFKPEYLTLFGKGDRLIAGAADKIGIPTKGQKQLIRERSKWFRQAKADFIAYRKWATGVAGGEKELAEIATSFPDPVKNTPTQYQANLDGIEETTKRILSTNKDFLRSGIDLRQPLEQVLNQARQIGLPIPVPGVPAPISGGDGGNVTIIRYDSEGNRIQ